MVTTDSMDKVLSTLDGIDPDKCREVMVDYDVFMLRVQHMIYVQTFIDHYTDAEKLYLTGNSAGEKKSLMFAMNIFESNNIMNEDLKDEDLQDYNTGTLLTSEKIANRQRELRKN